MTYTWKKYNHSRDQIYPIEAYVAKKNSNKKDHFLLNFKVLRIHRVVAVMELGKIQHLFYWRYCTSLQLDNGHKPWNVELTECRWFATQLWKCCPPYAMCIFGSNTTLPMDYNLSLVMKGVALLFSPLLSSTVHSTLGDSWIPQRFQIPRK